MNIRRYLLLLCIIALLLPIVVFSKEQEEITPTPAATILPTPTADIPTSSYLNYPCDDYYLMPIYIISCQYDEWKRALGQEEAIQKTIQWLNNGLKEPHVPAHIVKAIRNNSQPLVGSPNDIIVYFDDGVSTRVSTDIPVDVLPEGTHVTPTPGNPIIESQRSEITPIASSTTVPVEVNDKYVFETTWGSKGSGDGQFNAPTGIAVDPDGNVYVADSSNNRIQKFDSQGKFITKWGKPGDKDGEFNCPLGIAINPAGNVFVADYYNNCIKEFNANGTFIAKYHVEYPKRVSVNPAGDIFIVNGSSFITKLDSNNKRLKGIYMRIWIYGLKERCKLF